MAARVGLTGGIGSGKSTVLALFRGLGVPVTSADDIARSLTARGTTEFRNIVEVFGESVVDPHGEIDRSKLGRIVFDDEVLRGKLEAILHPGIRQEMQRFAEQASASYCMLEIPLLIETGQHLEMDRVLVVTCSSAIRRKRLQSSRDLSLEGFDRIAAAQLDDDERCRHADDTLANDGDMEHLRSRVSGLHTHYLELFANRSDPP